MHVIHMAARQRLQASFVAGEYSQGAGSELVCLWQNVCSALLQVCNGCPAMR